MTATNHALTGAVIALSVKQPLLAVPLAFLSHLFLDAIPHFGMLPGTFKLSKYLKFLVADFMILAAMVIFFAFIFTDKFWLVLLCMVVASGPDAFWWKYRKNLEDNDKKGVDRFNRFHWWIQWKEFPKGVFIEIVWFGLMGTLIILVK